VTGSHHGSSAMGGETVVETGDTGSQSGSITVVNTNLTRVHN
jgi:hypothetical protein